MHEIAAKRMRPYPAISSALVHFPLGYYIVENALSIGRFKRIRNERDSTEVKSQNENLQTQPSGKRRIRE